MVESNMKLFTKRQLENVRLTQNLQADLAFPSNQDLAWALQSNIIKDCPLTASDMKIAIKVWGPSIAMLKGKMVRTMPLPVQDFNKKMTLVIDIFFVNKVLFFIILSQVICFLLVTHLSNRKALNILNVLKEMCNYYLQQGFQIVFWETSNLPHFRRGWAQSLVHRYLT